MPFINKNQTFEKYIYLNRWTKKFWPNAATTGKPSRVASKKPNLASNLTEKAARGAQMAYMKGKITNERVGKSYAYFHPNDMSKWMKTQLESRGVFEK